jgi:hypothetical protein
VTNQKKAPPGISPGGAFAFSRRAHPRKPALKLPFFAATQGLLEPRWRCSAGWAGTSSEQIFNITYGYKQIDIYSF